MLCASLALLAVHRAPAAPRSRGGARSAVVSPTTPAPLPLVERFWSKAAYLSHHSEVLGDALAFAAEAHDGQRRRSGEAFIVHPIEVAIILAGWRMDADAIVAGLLHDTVEDTDVTVEQIEGRFGAAAASIVAGVTDGAAVPASQSQRELLLAISRDWRVALLKLADRTHNMRTLVHMPAAKQAAKSRETLDLFVPLARRLGVEEIERELDQLCVSYLGEERPDGPSLLDSLLEDERICLRRQRACWREHRGACASSV